MIAKLQEELATLNQAPTDTFPFGTVVVFSAQSGVKWYYVKKGEEIWKPLSNTGAECSLAECILTAKKSGVGYFEVYVLITQEPPIYASA